MSALKPDVDGTHDLGTTDLRWRDLHVDRIITATSAQGGQDCTIGTNLVVTGDLTVNGDTTTLSTTELVIQDKTITLANGAADSAAADGAGITVAGASATLIYDDTGTQWEFNKPLEVAGSVLPEDSAKASADLGSTTLPWNDLHLSSGGVINFNNGDVTATHSANLLTITGGNTRVDKLEIDAAGNNIDVDTDLKLTAVAGITLDAATDITLDAAGNDISFLATGGAGGGDATGLKWSQSGAGDWTNLVGAQDKDLIFQVNDGGSATEVMRLDGDVSSLLMAGTKKIEFGDAGSFIHQSADGKLKLSSDGAAADAIIIHASDNAGGIDIDAGTGNISITSPVVDINASTAVKISNDLELDSDEAILKFGGDGDVTLTHVEDTGLLLNSGMALQFGEAGENIKGDGNDLIITSGRHVDLNATNTLDIDAAAVDIETTGAFSIDGAAASNITVATDGVDENLTISVTGATASSLILSSAGTGTDAIDINATAGGIDIDANNKLALDSATGIDIGLAADVPVVVESSTFNLDASGAITIDGTSTIGIGADDDVSTGNISIGTADNQRVITVGNAIGNTSLDIDAGTGGIAVDTASGGAISVNATAAQLQLKTTTSGEIDITSAGALDLNSVSLTIDSSDTTNLTMAANVAGTRTLTIAATNANEANVSNIDIDADGTVDIDGASGINIGKAADVAFDIDAASVDWDCSGAFALDVTGGGNGISLDGVAASNFTTSSGLLTLSGGGGVTVTSTGGTLTLNGTGQTVDLDANALALDMTDSSNITITSSEAAEDLTIEQVGANDSSIIIKAAGTGADAIKISTHTNGGSIDINSDDNITVDAADTITLTTADTGADGKISLVSATTGSNVAIHLDGNANAASIVDIDAGVLDIDATAGITIDGTTLSIDSTDTTNLTMTANDNGEKVLTIDAVNSGAGAAKIALGATSGTAVSIGHTTSETTVNHNLTVIGDLIVQGTTTQIDTTNLRVEDRVIQLAKGDAADADVDQGFVFTRATANLGGDSDKEHGALFFKGSDNSGSGLFVLGVTNDDGSAAWAQGIADDDLSSLKIGKLMLDGTSNHIDVTSDDLTLTASANIDLIANSGNSDVVITGDVLPAADDTYDLGSTDFAWQDLHLEGDVLMTDAGQVATSAGILTLSGNGGVTVASTGGTLTLNGTGQTVDINATVLDLDMADASNITLASAADADDLTIELTGNTNSSIDIKSSGTGADAVKISTHTNSGSIDIDSADNITVDAADLITLTTADTGADGKISLVSATTGSNVAIHLDGNADTDAIVKIDAGALDLNASGTVDIDGAAGINIGKAADVAFDIDAASVDWDCSGAFALDVAGEGNGISLQGAAASDFTTGAGALTLSGAAGVTVTSTGGTLSLNGAGQTVNLDAAVLDLDMTDASNISLASAADTDDLTIELTGNTNSSIDIRSAGNGADAVKISTHTNGGSIDIDSADNITVDAAGEISLTSTAVDGLITLQSAHTAGQAIYIDANAAAGSILDVDAGVMDVDVQGAFTLDSTGISLDSDAASNFTTSSGALTLNGNGGVNIQGNAAEIDITTTGALDLNGAAVTVDGSTSVAIESSGPISVGAGDANGAINIGTDGERTITIGEDGQDDKTFKVHASAANIVLDAGSNNVAITGGLTASGAAILSDNVAIGGTFNDTAKFQVTASSGNTLVKGSLTLQNTLSTSAGQLSVKDSLVILSSDGRGNADNVDIGILGGMAANNFVGFFYDNSRDLWTARESLSGETSNDSNVVDLTNSTLSTVEVGQIHLNDAAEDGGNAQATPLTTHATYYVTAAAETSTLAAGTEGQIKVLAMKSNGGNALNTMTVTVAEGAAAWGGNRQIILTDNGDACTLQFIDSQWYAIGNNGCTIN